MTAIADKLGVEFALIHRERTRNPDGPEKMEVLVGDVRDKVGISGIPVSRRSVVLTRLRRLQPTGRDLGG